MAQKPANEDLSQQVSNLLNSVNLESLYESHMDAVLFAIGRTVKVYLPPAITPSASNNEVYNPWMRTKDNRVSPISEGNAGVNVETIFAVYKGHVVHGPRPIAQDIPFQLDVGDVQLTTVIGSKLDLDQAVEIEVDGKKYDMKKMSPRPIGLTIPKYVISIWTKKAGNIDG